MSTHLFYRRPLLTAFLTSCVFSLILITACSDDDPVIPEETPTNEVSGTVGAAGGTLEAPDGSLKLVVPAGALAADTEITITEVGAADVPNLSPGMNILKAFTMSPAGLSLAMPATLTFDVGLDVSKVLDEATVAFPVGLVLEEYQDGSTPQTFQEALGIYLDLNRTPVASIASLTLRGIFSEVALGKPQGSGAPTPTISTTHEVDDAPREGEEFIGRVGLTTSPGVDLEEPVKYLEIKLAGISSPRIDGESMEPDTEGPVGDGGYLRAYFTTYSALAEGPGAMRFGMRIKAELDFEEIYSGNVAPPIIVNGLTEIDFILFEKLVNILPPSGEAEYLGKGVYLVEEGLEGVKKVDIPGYKYDRSVLISSNTGTGFYSTDVADPFGDRYDLFNNGLGKVGAFLVGTTEFKKESPVGLAFVNFGPNGILMSPWLEDEQDFGISQGGYLGQNVTDGQAYGGLVNSGGFVLAVNTFGSVSLFEYDSGTSGFSQVGTISNFPGAAGAPVTAAVRPGGSALIVTDGTPGQIFTHDRNDLFAAAVLLGNAGDLPRRVRTGGGLAVISNFASDNLTVLTWTESDVVSLVGTVPVGDGPVGIDLQVQDGGNVAVASTGFNDNTYSVTILSPTGAVVSNTKIDLEAGAEGPGHLAWLGDPQNLLMVTCNTTGNVAVVESGAN